MNKHFTLAVVVVFACSNVAWGQRTNTTGGAAVGGAAGAIIGGIIGHQNDETPEGALIGGAVGAITGGLLGRAKDNQITEQQYRQQQAYYQGQQQAYAQQQVIAETGVNINDVVNMSRSGLNETLILNHIQAKGVQRRLEVSEIIALHQQGVSDVVISAMQSAPLAAQLAAPRTVSQPPVVVQQPRVVVQEPVIYQRPPVMVHEYYRPYPVYYGHGHRHGHHRSSSIHIGF
ncbi:glycine zipper domain-containing protein [Aureliella helgolandensis]|uniref:Glycine zipper 2TM domain protein n=1 Tax=Aureliella helgolandensis TaxID=2527968 RepID=A0A518G0B2_9BACT|nr:glycine zipper domain-containing protein [Aureliella helgolandensis]QDV22039.1 Glycine zipper 2TM domain protein [Aureliella helgolandensis]